MEENQQAVEATTASFIDRVWNAITRAIQGDTQGWNDFLQLTAIPALKALVVLFVCYLVGRFISKVVARPISQRVDTTLGRFVEKLIYRGTIATGFLFVLSQFGIKSTSFAAVIAAMGFAIGLAFQGTLGNFASGILLLVFRPFKVGDTVMAGAVVGKVTEIDLFTTAIDTSDNRRLIVPNSSIAGQTIENITYHPIRRLDLNISVPWHTDIEKTRAAFRHAIELVRAELFVDDEYQPFPCIVSITGASIDWQLQLWAKTSAYGEVREKAIVAVHQSFEQAGIAPAVPRYRVMMEDESESNVNNRTVPRRSQTASRPAA